MYNDFFLLATMIENEHAEKQFVFEDDIICASLTDCALKVNELISHELDVVFLGEEDSIKTVERPTQEDIYSSLYTDKNLVYIICNGSEEVKIVFHISKLLVQNELKNGEMEFCQR